MATRRKARKATPKRKPAATSAVRRALAERDEALKFQAATGEILKVIRRSTSDTQPVFEMIVRNAVSLCNGFFASAFRFDGERLHLVATSIVDPAARKFLAGQYPRPPDKAQMSGRAILARKVVRMEDALADPLYDRRHAEIGSWRRMLGVPMMDRGEPIGVIVVSWTDAGPIPKAQEELLKSFADQAVIAIENARLFKEVRERNAELKQSLDFQGATGGILASISRSVTDAQPVFEAIVDSVLRLFGTRYAAVFLIRGEELHLAASKGDPDFEKRRLAVFRQFRASFPQRIDWSGFTGKALRAGVVSQIAPIIGNPEATPQAVQLARDFGYNAMLLAPLMREGKAIGAIGTTRPEGEPFDAKQLALFGAFAAQAVIAIENARLFNETKEALERQTGTAQVLSAISGSPTDVAPVHQAILENATRLCEASFASVFLYDGEYLKAVAHLGASPAFAKHLDENRLRPSRETATRRAALEKRIVQVEDLLNDPEFAPGQAHRAENARTVLSVPMLREGALVGVITVWRREPRRFSDQQVGLLKTFADQAVIAIENVRLFNETREALEKQTATAEILRVISSTPTDATPVFEAIVRNSTRLCEAAYANVFRYDGERLHWAASDGWPAELLAELKAAYPTTPNRSRVAGRVILEGRAVRLEDTHADSEYDKTLGRSLRYRRILGVPLLREDRTVGVITVGWAAAGPIERRHEDLLKTFADQAVIAIENVRLFNETKEALERQTATADILRVISSSPTNIQPVLQAVAATAARLCEAKDAIIQLRDGDVLRFVAHHGKLPNVGVGGTRALSRELVTGRAVLEGRQIHVHDLQAQANEYPRGSEIAREFGYRTILATPLMREGVAIGSIMIRRAEARPFTETQLALMRTFADQAVIAIENVRLFNETKEALEQQKASAEVLGTISSSIADTRPVFEKILESCERLFAGKVVGINVLGKDGMIHLGAYHGAGREAFEEVFPLPVDRDSGSGLAIVERRVVHIPDSEADGVPEAARRGNRARGNRASLYAPMMWHDKAIGVVWVSRELPGPFSEKEIGLLKTFADQAVIAVENARLF
ncbi:MAG TPA: GAF domain-containing protein, partial [Burkholderiales bacterium]